MGGPRREIGIRTLFNILGPLTNPAGARRGVLGVYNDTLLRLVADASHALGAERLFVLVKGGPDVVVAGLVASVLVGLVASLPPALQAVLRPVADAVRPA